MQVDRREVDRLRLLGNALRDARTSTPASNQGRELLGPHEQNAALRSCVPREIAKRRERQAKRAHNSWPRPEALLYRWLPSLRAAGRRTSPSNSLVRVGDLWRQLDDQLCRRTLTLSVRPASAEL